MTAGGRSTQCRELQVVTPASAKIELAAAMDAMALARRPCSHQESRASGPVAAGVGLVELHEGVEPCWTSVARSPTGCSWTGRAALAQPRNCPRRTTRRLGARWAGALRERVGRPAVRGQILQLPQPD